MKIEKKEYLSLTNEDKIKIINDIKINHPLFRMALKHIKVCHSDSKSRKDPLSLIITGGPGVGKTTIFKEYVQQNDETIYTSTGTKKNILWATLPQPIRPNSLMEILLKQLGDRRFDKGSQQQKFDRLVGLIKDCGIELIMLDEFQHFINPKTKRPHKDVADWFKSLINHTNIPVVLFGLEDSLDVLKENQQLSRRFKRRVNLEPFGYRNKSDIENFNRLLQEIERLLPFEEPSRLISLSEKIYSATDGIMDNIMSLLREAAYIAIKENENKIKSEDLYAAFSYDGHLGNKNKINPF
ncbi:TniB protein [Peribacillus simplex]|uniref:TniB protein n=1 Tax=Peribacillus simplex TaxID=1478 RepID=A0A9X8WI26_9BACI|nr:ATP-binding protein [Peribacillus simplex]SIQ29383.1 TniB protein [Peribacillus simplex]